MTRRDAGRRRSLVPDRAGKARHFRPFERRCIFSGSCPTEKHGGQHVHGPLERVLCRFCGPSEQFGDVGVPHVL
jgi:hypothetical protein